jgi:NADH-quinone oxidoreductase subunit A
VLQDFYPIGVLIIVTTLLAIVVVVMSRIFGPFRPTRRKLMPYESGMDPIGPSIRRVPVKFYLTAVLFILFDIEVIFFLPWAVVMRRLGVFGLIEMFIFTAILLAGYAYAWRKGALQWD